MKRSFPIVTILIALFALTASAAWAGDAKVQVCHIPPGNPANFHTITVSENALSAHLGHGDLAGACFAHCDSLCSDGNACTIDACDASEHCISSHPPVNCDDSSLCTIDSCNPATGCASEPKICLDSDNCTVNSCDPLTGSCVAPPVVCPAGQSCDPDNGECDTQSQQTYNCTDRNPCTPENNAAGLFYFAADDPAQFIQCDLWEGCFEMTCPMGLVWIDSLKTCVYP
jgi:hypothetical protein